MLASFQDLRRRRPFCLAMLMPLRKTDADDIFHALPSSEQAPYVLWVLQHRFRQSVRTLHISPDPWHRSRPDGKPARLAGPGAASSVIAPAPLVVGPRSTAPLSCRQSGLTSETPPRSSGR